jgi:hypothetical protein
MPLINRKFVFYCQYCNWSSSENKLIFNKEADAASAAFQIKDFYNKGYLKKMYDHLVDKLKKNEQENTVVLNSDGKILNY